MKRTNSSEKAEETTKSPFTEKDHLFTRFLVVFQSSMRFWMAVVAMIKIATIWQASWCIYFFYISYSTQQAREIDVATGNRLRGVAQFAQGHPSRQWQRQDSNPRLSDPKAFVLNH